MVSANPFAEFRSGCETVLEDALKGLHPQISMLPLLLETPPSPEFGELSSSVCFELAKQTGKKPLETAEQIAEAINVSGFPLIQSVKAAGEGYINFYVNFEEFSRLTIESVRAIDTEYGYVKNDEPRKIIIEHTSVNPIHPIHIGQARNPMLGDALARILKAHGHTVFRHYYIDDVGRQSAVIAYGYEKLGRPEPEGKPDSFIGAIYAITSCIMEIQRLKKEVRRAKELDISEEFSKLQRELDDWTSVAADLNTRFPKLFARLLDEISKDEEPESQVNDLIRSYEAGEEKVKQLIREVCNLCLQGFKETLGRAGITLDSWDWESDFIWNSDVTRVLDKLKKTPYVFYVGNILEFDAEKTAQDLNLKETLDLREDYELSPLTLVRTDGTTLYTTRDIPYHLWKFQKAEKVINVIGMEQTLAQLQLKLALCALGHVDYAKKLVHFAYNLVNLPGYTMSSRRGRYITLDEVIDGAIKRAYEEVSKRSPHLSDEEKHTISEFVGIGAVKYALVEVDPTKPVVFTWDRVLDFEKNSAPYIQYSHARARSIMRKASREPENPDYSLLTNRLEHDIILTLARFPEVFVDAAENLRPHAIADYANALADKFNTFYTALPVIKAKPPELSDARLALVDATRMVLRNALNLLGIEAPERM
ncbi:MAG: Arginine--tRNA ligase [Candidatus Bathyarchaeota archaeon BA2]|nr:MAG: Arginine--tRNA ligase [Candidatus Bathyarchaeota archaeon BA2]